MQERGQRFCAMGVLRLGDEQVADPLHQQAVAAVLQHRQGEGVLQHLLQGAFVAAQRQQKVLCIKSNSGLRLVEAGRAGKQHLVGLGMRRGRKGKLGVQERDARIHQPAGQSMDVAQHRDQTKLALRAP